MAIKSQGATRPLCASNNRIPAGIRVWIGSTGRVVLLPARLMERLSNIPVRNSADTTNSDIQPIP